MFVRTTLRILFIEDPDNLTDNIRLPSIDVILISRQCIFIVLQPFRILNKPIEQLNAVLWRRDLWMAHKANLYIPILTLTLLSLNQSFHCQWMHPRDPRNLFDSTNCKTARSQYNSSEKPIKSLRKLLLLIIRSIHRLLKITKQLFNLYWLAWWISFNRCRI